MLNRRSALAAGVLTLALALSACGSESGSAPASALDSVKVTSTDPKAAPTVDLTKKPLTVSATQTKVITAGKGATVAQDDLVRINAEIINATTGKVVTNTWDSAVAGVDLGATDLIPALRTTIPGQKVGSRLLVAAPPAEAFGTQGSTSLGISGTDSVVFLIDVVSVVTSLKEATGTAVPPKAGLPTVKLTPGKPAQFTMPKNAKAPAKLVVQPLVKGNGAVVAKGETIRVHYTGAIWGSGKVFDSSASRGAPASFQIGVGAVVPGWDKGLVGQKVGSRVLLVLPPAEGYGAAGNSGAGIKGTDTLVFVVDILAAY